MSKFYSVGPEELAEYELKQAEGFDWLVYWYESGCYDGSGEAVALGTDGLLYVKNLGHCSCYGPMDDWATGCSKVTAKEFLREKDNVLDHDCMDVIKKKVKSLLRKKKK